MAAAGQEAPSTGDQKSSKRLMDTLDSTVERMREDPLRLVSWFVVLVWFGVVLLLMALDVIKPKITPEVGGDISAAQKGWAVFAWGGGAVALVETLIRLIVPRWRGPATYSFIWGVVGLGVGFSLWYDSWGTLGPIGIIGLGLILVAWVVVWQRKGTGMRLEEKIRKIKESPMRFVTVDVLIIWFGVSLLLMALEVIGPKMTPDAVGDISASQRGWAVFALGGSAVFFLETLARLIVQRWRSPFIYAFVWGLTWLAVGLSLWFNNWTALGPIVFIGLGLILLGLLLPRPER